MLFNGKLYSTLRCVQSEVALNFHASPEMVLATRYHRGSTEVLLNQEAVMQFVSGTTQNGWGIALFCLSAAEQLERGIPMVFQTMEAGSLRAVPKLLLWVYQPEVDIFFTVEEGGRLIVTVVQGNPEYDLSA
jgi:hypothetical protein